MKRANNILKDFVISELLATFAPKFFKKHNKKSHYGNYQTV